MLNQLINRRKLKRYNLTHEKVPASLIITEVLFALLVLFVLISM
jgi:hypothetical protein